MLTSLAMILGEEEQRLKESKPNVHKGVCLKKKEQCFWHKSMSGAVTKVTSKHLSQSDAESPVLAVCLL